MTTTDLPPDLLARLKAHGQEHVLHGWDSLSAVERAAFVRQLAALDFDQLRALYAKKDDPSASLPPRDRIAPLPVEQRSAESVAVGEAALQRGEVAVLVVAGGQGTRLGYDQPKGMFPVGPVSEATLFRIHAEKVFALSRRYGQPVPFLVMTSPATHTETEEYLHRKDYFGLA